MMKEKSPAKFVLLFLGGIVVICMAVSVILFTLLDDDDYKRLLTWAVKHYTDYTISIAGELSLDLSMEPSLSVSQISVLRQVNMKSTFSLRILDISGQRLH
jgi:uncharacterized protein involved in outer membrane biogenesis